MADIRTPQTEDRERVITSMPSPRELQRQYVDKTVSAIQRSFDAPIEANGYRFEQVGDLKVGSIPDPYDFAKIAEVTKKKKLFGVPVKGRFRIVDTKTNEVVDEKEVALAKIPVPTWQRTLIVKGRERALMHQWRRKAGVFNRTNQKGEIVSEYNLDPSTSSNLQRFSLQFDRGDEGTAPKFRFLYGASKGVNAWSVAKLLGATDEELAEAVGPELQKAVTSGVSDKKYRQDVTAIYDKLFKGKGESSDQLDFNDIESVVRQQFEKTSIDPGISKVNLGTDADRVNKSAVLASFKRMADISNGGKEDNRESLALKNLMTPADLLAESVGRQSNAVEIQSGIRYKLMSLQGDTKPNIDQILKNTFQKKLEARATTSMVQRSVNSTTPLDSFAQATATTLIGEGAIKSDQSIPEEAKLLNQAGVGYLDPVHTPESSRAGVVLHLPMKTRAVVEEGSGTDKALPRSILLSRFLSKDGKEVELPAAETVGKVIGGWDQFEMTKGGKPKARVDDEGKVKAFIDGEAVIVDPKEIDLWVQDHAQVFDVNSALIPFQNSIQGGRIGYSAKQTQQSIPLVNREEPLVQTSAPGSKRSLEELMGEESGALFAPYDGKVLDVIDEGPNKRVVRVLPSGKKRPIDIQVPKNLTMPGGTPLDSEVRVKPGDAFKRGDLLADSTFTKNGKLAMGVNLDIVYLPYYGGTFEDAIAISESAAKKMTSMHMYDEESSEAGVQLGKSLYKSTQLPLTKHEEETIGSDGIVKPGTILKPGQAIMVGKRSVITNASDINKAATVIGVHGTQNKRGITLGNRFFEKRWTSPYEGEVISAEPEIKNGKVVGAKLQIRTVEPMEVGDKVYGRHGNKGVIAEIIPDDEMLRRPSGKPVDIIFNSAGVASRINPSQNFESFMGKIAAKIGKPEIIDNWNYKSNWDYVSDRLKQANVSDAEDVFDPRSGKTLKNIGVGTQYILKAKQQVEHKQAARSIGGFSLTGQVVKGDDGAQALGELGAYALLGQDAREFLRDAQLYKSEDRPEVWTALERGQMLPGAKVPESFTRFKDYLTAAGVEVRQDRLSKKFVIAPPMTDKRIVEMTKTGNIDNVLTAPHETLKVKAKEDKKGDVLATDKPVPGGLFDPKATGGAEGKRWSRFELSAAIPNPLYERPIKDMLGLSNKDFEEIMAGVRGVKIGDTEKFGSEAIGHMLSKVDLKKTAVTARNMAANSASDKDRSRAYRMLRTVKMLQENKMQPDEAFMRKNVLVMPPYIRGLRRDSQTGDLVVGDLNYLYRDLALVDRELRKAKENKLPPKIVSSLEASLYDGMRALLQTEGSGSVSGADYQGILGVISGRRPDVASGRDISDVKQSFAKKNLLERRQIMSARTVLTPDAQLGLDEVGLPRRVGVAIYEPKIEAEYKKMNPNYNIGLNAEKFKRFRESLKTYREQNKPDAEVDRYLDRVIKGQYVVVKRDPALHKFSVQGFAPVLNSGKTISLNPAVYGGFNADNDGDTLAVYAPVSPVANAEIRDKMLPSQNLFNLGSHNVEHGISHEAILGLSRMTKPAKKMSGKTPSYDKMSDAEAAFIKGEIEYHTEVSIGGKTTTLGMEKLNNVLPAGMKLPELQGKGILPEKPKVYGFSKKNVGSIIQELAQNHSTSFSSTISDLRKIGQEAATLTGASLRMKDLKPVLVEERRAAEKKLVRDLSKIQKIGSQAERQRETRRVFADVLNRLKDDANLVWEKQAGEDDPNVNVELTLTGARVKPTQLQQVVLAPGALLNTAGDVIGAPVMRSYSEGLDSSGYMSSLHGARMGTVSKVQQVREPGYLTKQLVNTAIDMTITMEDCGTSEGVMVDLADSSQDAANRALAVPASMGNKTFQKGTWLNSQIITDINRSANGSAMVKVRSPLRCQAPEGVCKVCAGKLPDGKYLPTGHNLGLTSAQALGERSTQMMLSLFHEGGVYNPSASLGAADLYKRTSALLRMPSGMGGMAAKVSEYDSEVTSVSKNTLAGGWDLNLKNGKKVYLENEKFAPDGSSIPDYYRKNPVITRGQPLTDGLAHPREILRTTGDISKVQDSMVRELGNMFASTGVLRRNVEAVVRKVTDTVEIIDSGGSQEIPGARMTKIAADEIKKKYPRLKYRPIIKGVDVAPKELREDWLAAMNYNDIRRQITGAAQIGAESFYHSTNPIPALYYGAEFNRAGLSGLPRNDGRY